MDCFVIMGVSGCGKSSVGAAFAQAISAVFIDGDDLHPAANRAKMASGQALNDADRDPWLIEVGRALRDHNGAIVIGCSALKRHYRDKIRSEAGRPVMFVYLKGTRKVLAARMAARTGHFMPASLLDSQLATLEPPMPDEMAMTVAIDQSLQAIVDKISALTRVRAGLA